MCVCVWVGGCVYVCVFVCVCICVCIFFCVCACTHLYVFIALKYTFRLDENASLLQALYSLSYEMDTVTRVQILDEGSCPSHCTNTLGKDMRLNLDFLPWGK